jgi:hypothetical protein
MGKHGLHAWDGSWVLTWPRGLAVRVAQAAWQAGPGRQGMTPGQGRVPAPEGELYSEASDTPRKAERIYLLWVR